MKRYGTLLFTIFTLLLTSACQESNDQRLLRLAESQVTNRADSCMLYLDSIQVEKLSGEEAALCNLFRLWTMYRQYEKVIPVQPLEDASVYFADHKNPQRRAQYYYLRSVIREDQKVGNQNEWLADMYQACLAIEGNEDHVLAAQIYQRYEHKLYEMHQYKESIIWADRYRQEAEASGRIGDQILSLTNLSLSQVMLEQEETKKRINYNGESEVALHDSMNWEPGFNSLYKALSLAIKHNIKKQEGKVCNVISSYYSDRQMPDSAHYYALRSVRIQEQFKAEGKVSEPINYLSLAESYRRLGMADSCIHYARKTLLCNGIFTRRNAANLLVHIYNDIHNYEEQTHWMQVYQLYQDTIHTQIEQQQIGGTEAAVQKEAEKTALQQKTNTTLHWIGLAICVLIIALVLVIRTMRANRKKYKEQYQKQVNEINQLIAEMQRMKQEATAQAASAAAQPAITDNDEAKETAPSTVALTGSTRDQLNIDPESILSLTSESNYIKVIYLNEEGMIRSKMLRQTMSRIEEILAPCSFIVRCHRAFFVNLHHVTHASSIPNGLLLRMDHACDDIPVSRTYISTIKERLINQ